MSNRASQHLDNLLLLCNRWHIVCALVTYYIEEDNPCCFQSPTCIVLYILQCPNSVYPTLEED